MSATLLITYTQKIEYRVPIPNDPTQFDIGEAIRRACDYLSTGNLSNVDLDSIKFSIEDK